MANSIVKSVSQEQAKMVETLYKQHNAKLQVVAKAIVKIAQIAEDMVHEVFEFLLHSDKKFEPAENVAGYLVVAVRNRCYNYLVAEQRKENHHGKFLLTEDNCELAVAVPSEIAYFEAVLAKRALDSVQKLKGKHRKVIISHYWERKSFAEIANELSISVENVRTLKSQALDKLRRMEQVQVLSFILKVLIPIALAIYYLNS